MSIELANLESLISGALAKQFQHLEKNLDSKIEAKLLAIRSDSNVNHSNDNLSDQIINDQITDMPASEVFVPEENNENSNTVNQQVPTIEVVEASLVADFPWLKADDSYDIKLGRNLIKKNMKRFSYLVGGGFDFRMFADKPSSLNQLNLTWLEGSGYDDLMNISVDSKGDWDDFVNGIGKVFDCYSIELNKFYKDIDGQKMGNSEVAQFCQDFVRAFPLVQTKYFHFKY